MAFLGDLFEDLADAGGLMSFSYQQVYGFVPAKYKRHNFYASVSYAFKTGNLTKIKKGGKPYLRLTGQGKKKITRDFPLFSLQTRRWDRKWRLIPYDIKEAKSWQRDSLREKLCQLGFRQLQKSVYISPQPIEEELNDFLKTLRLEGKVWVLLCQKILGIESKELAKELWQLDELNDKYRRLWERLVGVEEEKTLREVAVEYLDLLNIDPFLPYDLLPKEWYEKKIRKRLKQKARF